LCLIGARSTWGPGVRPVGIVRRTEDYGGMSGTRVTTPPCKSWPGAFVPCRARDRCTGRPPLRVGSVRCGRGGGLSRYGGGLLAGADRPSGAGRGGRRRRSGRRVGSTARERAVGWAARPASFPTALSSPARRRCPSAEVRSHTVNVDPEGWRFLLGIRTARSPLSRLPGSLVRHLPDRDLTIRPSYVLSGGNG